MCYNIQDICIFGFRLMGMPESWKRASEMALFLWVKNGYKNFESYSKTQHYVAYFGTKPQQTALYDTISPIPEVGLYIKKCRFYRHFFYAWVKNG